MVDIHTGQTIPLTEAPSADYDLAATVSPDGRFALVLSEPAPSLSALLVDLSTGEVSNTDPGFQSSGQSLITFSSDSQWVFVSNGSTLLGRHVGDAGWVTLSVGEDGLQAMTAL